MPSISKLPNELTSAILRYLVQPVDKERDDDDLWFVEDPEFELQPQSSLKLGSMTCRLWRALALPYLFAEVRVQLDKERSNLKAFRAFLVSSSYLAPYVRRLRVEGWSKLEVWTSVKHLALLDLSDLATAMNELPNLRDLNLRSVRVSEENTSLPTTLSSPIPLNNLTLSVIHSLGPVAHGGLARIFDLFSSVENLNTRWLWSDGFDSIDDSVPRRALGVKGLATRTRRADSRPTGPFLELLRYLGVFYTYNTLTLSPLGGEELDSAPQFIWPDNSSLRTIILTLTPTIEPIGAGDPDTHRECLHPLREKISSCTNLHRIHLNLSVSLDTIHLTPTYVEWMTSLPLSVRHVTVSVSSPSKSMDLVRGFPWADLARLCGQMRQLRSVVFQLGSGGEEEASLRRLLEAVDDKAVPHVGRDPSCAECGCDDDF